MQEFEFANPHYLWALPLCLLVLFFSRPAAGLKRYVSFSNLALLQNNLHVPQGLFRRSARVTLCLCLLFLLLALARPQLLNRNRVTSASGVDIMLAVDLSLSMLADDMLIYGRPATRLAAAKNELANFISLRPQDRMGIIAFAGKTKIAAPLTPDHGMLQQQLRWLSTRYIKADGTAIGSAIASCSTNLANANNSKSRIMVLVTDGASNSGDLAPLEAARMAGKLGIKIYTIAVGSEQGRLDNRAQNELLFDEKTLREVARISNGKHYRAQSTDDLNTILDDINKLEKSEYKYNEYVLRHDLFSLLLAMALACIISLMLQFALRREAAP